ncbi:orotidine-5'-phosphate decarboxylase [uncultured Cytophaga sp.]|uniref:orotidine-5'-phosphate decarboxylase n=1 Tax=uncultured Cytophaga sp. TaxID=160238 RepID=UPI00261351FB|nr:orotidine-5'-phosphate decarboxylase [uncultured Cytophaga sp.]
MNKAELVAQIKNKKSYLCVGLDTDPTKIPSHLLKEKDPIFEFNKYIIDATIDYTVAYKPNLAFYESLGKAGWESLEKTLEWIPKDVFTIADAKRGDIGNTATMYAKAFFEQLSFDSVTVAPYMGEDSVTPFLAFKDKWAIVLGLTSNAGSKDFQQLTLKDSGEPLYKEVLKKCATWGSSENLMFVVGATKASYFKEIRSIVPDHFLLVPGVGAQGGNLQEVSEFGLNASCGLLVNSSRNILYARSDDQFAGAAKAEAKKMQQEMKSYLEDYLNW